MSTPVEYRKLQDLHADTLRALGQMRWAMLDIKQAAARGDLGYIKIRCETVLPSEGSHE